MQDWLKKIEKNLGKNTAKYVFSNAKMVENHIVFTDEALFAAALRDKNALEKIFPDVVVTCWNYGVK